MNTFEFCESIGSSGLNTAYKRKQNTVLKYKTSPLLNFCPNTFLKELSVTKLRFPFLTESQIQGRTLDKFGIPNIMGKPYKVNGKCSIIMYSVSQMISTVRKLITRRNSNDKYPFKKRRNTTAGIYTPLDVNTHKISRKNKSKASKNLLNLFTLYSEEREMPYDNYSIESASEAGSLEEFTNEDIFSVQGSCKQVDFEKANESVQSIKTYERKKGNNLQLSCIFKANNNILDQSVNSTHRISNIISEEDNVNVSLRNTLSQDDINEGMGKYKKIKHLNKKREINLEKKLIPKHKKELCNEGELKKIMLGNQATIFSEKTQNNISNDFIVTENEIMDETTHNSDGNSLSEDLDRYNDIRNEENLRYVVRDASGNREIKHNYCQYKTLNNKQGHLCLIKSNDYECQHSLKADIHNAGHLNEESDEINSNEPQPVNQSQGIYVRKVLHPNEIINSEVKRNRSINFLALKDNRFKKTTGTSQIHFSNSDKQHFYKRIKKIKQSISINLSEHLFCDASKNIRATISFNTETTSVNSTSTIRTVKISQSESTMEEACTMELPCNKKLKSYSEKVLHTDKSQECRKILKKSSECIILIDGQLQTDSILNSDHNFMIKDSFISSKNHSTSEASGKSKSSSVPSDGYYSENADFQDDDSLSQLSDKSVIVANNDNKTIHSSPSTKDNNAMGQHLNLIQGKFSPAFVTTTHLLLNDWNDSTDGSITSQVTLGSSSNVSRIIPDAISRIVENVEINEGYYLANLFDNHTNLPLRRTLRSASSRELSSEENDEALLMD